MAKALTAASLLKLKADPSRRREIADGILTGLYFVIQPTGRKSWAVRYRASGIPKKVTLGNSLFGDDVDAAGEELTRIRREAAHILDRVRRGEDPGAEKQAAKREVKDEDRDKFQTVVERNLKEYASKRRGATEKARLLGMRLQDGEWITNPERAVGLWGDKRIQDITRRDIREHLEKLAATAPIGANRTFAELRKFFNWTVGKDILTASPMTDLQAPSEENNSRNRILTRRKEVPGSSDNELRWLWQACKAYDGAAGRGPFGLFLQLLVMTGQRRSEVAEMTWGEIDMEAAEWTIPAARSKNGEPHVVPLSKQALAILRAVPRIKSKAGYVFTTGGESPISGFSRMKLRVDKLMAKSAGETKIADWTLHDIRRTVAAGMQRLGVRMEVTEKVLNHKSGSFRGIAAIYQVDDYADEKRAALDVWGRFVIDLVEGKAAQNVVPLQRTSA
ncbi:MULTISPECIES: site-specific integrase [unclassified Mesorhizobium]|uniref:tyrosine-type recombinase/integrase n=1 Tax=unclassified Mesorhizobium TaxID=325217 RepID=UPI0003CDD159|nr:MULTISPECIES: site-specific integrase [unclassified Mesorhizobium]ESY57287.1 integrase [Mesorhizobium sp. LNJC374B00]ESY59984.1 integrase [Mesorhizobium sp. LNJC372A00]WJI78776.1 tyrosine-type recombinase/integrase [Mesorhizobium sp. C374B]WJI85311.1 tyrosine-type recombinase/integrase [Mesorhizobium sp. C372A]